MQSTIIILITFIIPTSASVLGLFQFTVVVVFSHCKFYLFFACLIGYQIL